MSVLWEFYQQRRIGAAEADARVARGKGERLEGEVRRLRRDLDRMMIGCQAMWELLREFSGLDEEVLARRVEEVDLRDGRADGRMGVEVVVCGACGRRTSRRRGYCVICGEVLEGGGGVFGG